MLVAMATNLAADPWLSRRPGEWRHPFDAVHVQGTLILIAVAVLRASQAMIDGDAWQMICVNMAARWGKQGFEDGMVMKPYSSR